MSALATLAAPGLANPYLAAFLHLTGGRHRERVDDPWGIDLWSRASSARHSFACSYSWAIPHEGALRTLLALSPLVEIGAGGGYWAHLLRQRGGDVVAYDRAPGTNHWVKRLWTHVEVGGARPAGDHPDRTLLLCWPPYDHRLAELALCRYLRAGGTTVAYIGEIYGCCANDSFFDLLENELEQRAEISIPQWPGIHDVLTVWDRKEGAGIESPRA